MLVLSGPRWPLLLQAPGPCCQPWELLQGPWAFGSGPESSLREQGARVCEPSSEVPQEPGGYARVSCGHVCTCAGAGRDPGPSRAFLGDIPFFLLSILLSPSSGLGTGGAWL